MRMPKVTRSMIRTTRRASRPSLVSGDDPKSADCWPQRLHQQQDHSMLPVSTLRETSPERRTMSGLSRKWTTSKLGPSSVQVDLNWVIVWSQFRRGRHHTGCPDRTGSEARRDCLCTAVGLVSGWALHRPAWLLPKGDLIVGPNLSLLGQYLIGFQVTWPGHSLTGRGIAKGLCYRLVDGLFRN